MMISAPSAMAFAAAAAAFSGVPPSSRGINRMSFRLDFEHRHFRGLFQGLRECARIRRRARQRQQQRHARRHHAKRRIAQPIGA
jgi:hypothetical protein